MDKEYFQKIFSEERTRKYFISAQSNEAGIEYYKINIEISETFYPLLSVLEVALRNSISNELTKYFNSSDWFNYFIKNDILKDLDNDISKAKEMLIKRNEKLLSGKIVAELTLGFWNRLFNVEYEMVLWKELRKAFPFCPKNQKQRKYISNPLNKIRIFRNRIYHYEPISWDFIKLVEIHDEIIKLMGWINNQLPEFVNDFDRFNEVINRAKTEIIFKKNKPGFITSI